MPEPSDQRPPRAHGVAYVLMGLSMVMLTASSAILALAPTELPRFQFALLAAFGVLGVAAVVAFALGGWRPSIATRAARRERLQWQRWQSCLFTFPVIFTNLAFLSDHLVRLGDAAGVTLGLMLPLCGLLMLGQIMPPRRGEPHSWRRRQFEDLADELSQQHAATAIRSGYYALLAGALATLATAALVPGWAVHVAIATLWLGFVATCVHFGLLQRAAERDS